MNRQPENNKVVAYNDQAIWGIGETSEEALKSVEQQISKEDFEELLQTIETAKISDKLLDLLERGGGENLSFRVDQCQDYATILVCEEE